MHKFIVPMVLLALQPGQHIYFNIGTIAVKYGKTKYDTIKKRPHGLYYFPGFFKIPGKGIQDGLVKGALRIYQDVPGHQHKSREICPLTKMTQSRQGGRPPHGHPGIFIM